MVTTAQAPFPYRRPPELDGAGTGPIPVAIVGAGPVGLAAAIDLALRGVRTVVLDEDDTVSVGSRAICWAKRTLEIFDRLGIGERMVAKGVTWQVGRVYHGDRELYSFDLLPEAGHKMPAFINLQQYYVEQYLIERAAAFPDLIDLRWRHRVAGLAPRPDGVALTVETPDGTYRLDAEWVVAADGARSPVRTMLGLPFEGQRFEEKFLIADIKVVAPFPSERRFWFAPTFDPGESVLIHRQPDDVFRIDFQLGPDADEAREREPERVASRVRAIVGDVPFTLEWCSVYRFRCARLDRFVHGRVVFAGDSAHVVSPFGARGGNGGIQDVDNLAWKLAAVLHGEAAPGLVASYDAERGRGADENILHSSRTTTFMTPKSAAERHLREGVLALAARHGWAQALVNAGRLSRPCELGGLPLQTPTGRSMRVGPGAPCLDAPVLDAAGRPGWLLNQLGGGFTVLHFAHDMGSDDEGSDRRAVRPGGLPTGLQVVVVVPPASQPTGAATVVVDRDGTARSRYEASPGTTLLVRPDQHVAARFDTFDVAGLAAAYDRALGRTERARLAA